MAIFGIYVRFLACKIMVVWKPAYKKMVAKDFQGDIP